MQSTHMLFACTRVRALLKYVERRRRVALAAHTIDRMSSAPADSRWCIEHTIYTTLSAQHNHSTKTSSTRVIVVRFQ